MSDLLDWLDMLDLKRKRLAQYEDEDVSPRYHLNSSSFDYAQD